MKRIFAAIALGLMCGVNQAKGLQLPTPEAPAPGQIDTPHSGHDFDQDAAHDCGAHCQKVRPVLPLHPPYVDQPEVSFVHQDRGLDRVLRALVVKVLPRHLVQFGIDELDNLSDD